MSAENNEILDMFCAALDMKEKKRALYEKSMNGCSSADDIGRETFRMLMDAEGDHTTHIQEIYNDIKQGKSWADACRYYPDQAEGLKSSFDRIVAEHSRKPDACVDQVVAIDTGLQLEDASIHFFEEKLPKATEAIERQFIEKMITDEREHYRTLADLKFYYTDPEAWFMEKSRVRLDGA
jgi:rubrerythrin